MKILMSITGLGGAEQLLFDLVMKLKEDGNNIKVVYFDSKADKFVVLLEEIGVECFLINRKSYSLRTIKERLFELIRYFKPD